jgi:hypothetical protein
MKGEIGWRVAATAAAAVTLSAGCSSLSGGEPEDLTAVVRGSAAALQEGNYSFTATAPATTTTGRVHLPSRSATLTTEDTKWGNRTVGEVRLIGHHWYEDITGSPRSLETGRHWTRLDHRRLRPDPGRLSWDDLDLTGATTVLSGVESATRNGSIITGTLDGTKAMAIVDARSRKDPTTPTEAEAAPLRSVPYESKHDDAGRLTSLVFDLPQFGLFFAGRWSIGITGYGASSPVPRPPAADTLEADKAIYERYK